MWTPIVVTDRETGRKVHCTIMDRSFLESGFFCFDDLWEMYKDDFAVKLMNGMKA